MQLKTITNLLNLPNSQVVKVLEHTKDDISFLYLSHRTSLSSVLCMRFRTSFFRSQHRLDRGQRPASVWQTGFSLRSHAQVSLSERRQNQSCAVLLDARPFYHTFCTTVLRLTSITTNAEAG